MFPGSTPPTGEGGLCCVLTGLTPDPGGSQHTLLPASGTQSLVWQSSQPGATHTYISAPAKHCTPGLHTPTSLTALALTVLLQQPLLHGTTQA